jgi:hypothetical protein
VKLVGRWVVWGWREGRLVGCLRLVAVYDCGRAATCDASG